MILRHRLAVIIAAGVMITACNLSPLRNRIKVGEEALVVFVGEGVDGKTDLFVAPAVGGSIVQLTYTPLVESKPHINLRGDAVAFLRTRDNSPAGANEVVLMNLLNGAERSLPIPAGTGHIRQIAWDPVDTNWIYLQGEREIHRISTPPLAPEETPLSALERARAEHAFGVWVGEPPFAMIYECPKGGICAVGRSVDTTVLASTGHDPLRWGSDSVAWFDGDGMVIRGAGPGAARRMLWKHPPAKPRDGSYSGVTNAAR